MKDEPKKPRKKGRGGPRPGSGRKPLPEGQKRDRRVMLNVTRDEFERLMSIDPDESASNVLREALSLYLDEQPKSAPRPQARRRGKKKT